MQLIEIFQPVNIGASARALKNMGFRNLELVNPVHHITDEDRFMACNAIDLLERVQVDYMSEAEWIIIDSPTKKAEQYLEI